MKTRQAQHITAPDGSKMVVIPEKHYKDLLNGVIDNIEDFIDIKSIEGAIDNGALEDAIPSEVIERIFDTNEHPTRIFREWRGLTVEQLAKKVKTSQSNISMIENGKRAGTVELYQRIAKALKLDLELVVPLID